MTVLTNNSKRLLCQWKESSAMRIIAGTARGKRLKSLEGIYTRPTSDKGKEAIFNIIQFELPGRHVLDLFGGSGQLAIEAVSRGAAHADVVENSRAAFGVILENIKSSGFSDRIKARLSSYSEFIKNTTKKYDVIFLDPPYKSNLMDEVISRIIEFDILSNSGIIVCEFEINSKPFDTPENYYRKDYSYGRTGVCVFRKMES